MHGFSGGAKLTRVAGINLAHLGIAVIATPLIAPGAARHASDALQEPGPQ